MALKSEFKNASLSSVANTFETLYTVPVGMSSVITALLISSSANSGVLISVVFHDASETQDIYLARNMIVPVSNTLLVVQEAKVNLEEGDYVKVICHSNPEVIDVFASVIENVNSA